MNKITLLSLCLISSPFAIGETFYGLGFTRLNLDDSGVEVDAFSGVIGHEFGKRNFSLSPQFRYLKHKKTGVITSGQSTLDDAIIFSLKAQYTFKNRTYVFASPSLGSFNYTKHTSFSFGLESDEFEYGLNTGIGYEFNKHFSTELTYDEFKNSNAITAGINFRF